MQKSRTQQERNLVNLLTLARTAYRRAFPGRITPTALFPPQNLVDNLPPNPEFHQKARPGRPRKKTLPNSHIHPKEK